HLRRHGHDPLQVVRGGLPRPPICAVNEHTPSLRASRRRCGRPARSRACDFDATKAGITVGQEQRPSDVPATRSYQWSRGFSAPVSRQAPGGYATTCEPDIGRRSEVQSVNRPSTMYMHPRVRLVFTATAATRSAPEQPGGVHPLVDATRKPNENADAVILHYKAINEELEAQLAVALAQRDAWRGLVEHCWRLVDAERKRWFK